MDLYYKKYGDDGPALVILHGLLGASGNWHTLSRNVFSERFQVYTVDQRNHGRSPHSDRFDYPTLAADLLEFVDRHELQTAHVLGHSMGGKTAMRFAVDHADRLDRLVVADIGPQAYTPHHQHIFEALRSLDLAAFESRQEIDAALAEHLSSRPVRQFLLKNLDRDSDTGRYSWKMNLEGLHRNYDSVNVGLDEDDVYEGPTLFIRGGASDYIADDDVPRIRQHFPQARVVTLDGVGHWVHAEAPEAFGRVVNEFLTASM